MLVEKYMKLGIIKKFEIKVVPNYKLFSEVWYILAAVIDK
jgi:hypothetical protein